jgi:hypothetical protein
LILRVVALELASALMDSPAGAAAFADPSVTARVRRVLHDTEERLGGG